jgi:excisionase family DNA binding protein
MAEVCLNCLGQLTKAQPVVSTEKLLFKIEEAAKALSISVRTIHYRIKNGQLAARKEGRSLRIHRAELVRYSRMDHPSVHKANRKGGH